MNLKNEYESFKYEVNGKKAIYTIIGTIIILFIYSFIVYLGWTTIIVKVFKAPSLTYLQTVGLLFWLLIVKSIFSIK